MRGSTRLGLALLTLLALWVVVYWLTQPPTPRDAVLVTYDEPPPELREPPPSVPDPSPQQAPQPRTSPGPASPGDRASPSTDTPAADSGAQAAPPVTPAPEVIPPTFRLHTVQRNETASSLSRLYFNDDKHAVAIMMSNPNIDFQHLREGRVVKIPLDPANIQGVPNPDAKPPEPAQATSYTVVAGDTLGAISRRFYGTSTLWSVIRDANAAQVNEEGTNIRPGMVLTIPARPADGQ